MTSEQFNDDFWEHSTSNAFDFNESDFPLTSGNAARGTSVANTIQVNAPPVLLSGSFTVYYLRD